jgi:GT2 family glycosyltransferase/glycosyltransferase involved in cell wall biosynthesis
VNAQPRGEAPEGVLGIVVVNYASHELVARHLGAMDLDGIPVRVIVVDNFSSAAERDAISALAEARGWHLVGLPDNRGFGVGVNAGVEAARAAGCACFLLLNPDASLEPAVVEELRRQVLRDPMALVSPRLVAPDGSVFFAGSRVLLDSGRIRGHRSTVGPSSATTPSAAQEWLTGACVAVHDELLRTVGGLDEDYFLYWEDVDLSRRVLAAGGRLVLRDDLLAVHDAGGTQGPRRGRAKSALYYRYNCRNRLLFAARHLPPSQVLRWMAATPAVSWEILMRGGRRQLLTRPGLLLAAARGSLSGLRVAGRAVVSGRRGRDGRPGSVLAVHPGAELYGSDRMFVESVAGLAVDRPVVAVLPGPGPLAAKLADVGADVVFCPMPVLRKSALRPRGLVALAREVVTGLLPAWRLLRRHGSGGVYVNTITVPFWLLLGRLARRRVTVHVHEAEGSAPRLVRFVLAAPSVLAHRVVVNSRFSQDVLVGAVHRLRERSAVVYNGVAGPPSPRPPRARLAGPVQLAYVGRLSPRKGPDVAVDVLEELVGRGLDARLRLAGSVFPGYEWFEDQLRETVRDRGLCDRVDFLGFLPDAWSVYQDADVVLIPSRVDEPFGNTAVEALLAARPTVVSATSGLREAAAGAASAQIVPPGDTATWADAVERVVANWTEFARGATVDADEFGRRHAPARYRAEIARAVTSARGASR